jgi:hypothetical protein
MTTTRFVIPLHERWHWERWNAASCYAAAASEDRSLRISLTECAPQCVTTIFQRVRAWRVMI